MVLVLKLGRLDFLELLSERRHDCKYSKARQENATRADRAVKLLSVIVYCTSNHK